MTKQKAKQKTTKTFKNQQKTSKNRGKIVKDVVKLQTLNEAFELLRTLDTPINKYEALQKLCRADWIPGVQIDLVFSRSPAYQLVLLRVCAHMGVCVCAHACVR